MTKEQTMGSPIFRPRIKTVKKTEKEGTVKEVENQEKEVYHSTLFSSAKQRLHSHDNVFNI